MQGEKSTTDPARASFRAVLRANLPAVLAVLLAAAGLRLGYAFLAPVSNSAAGDPRYLIAADNLLAGRGFSVDLAPPYRPTAASVPLYPLFMAGVYAVAGRRPEAVRVAQCALDLLTCLLVSFVSFRLAPPRLKKRAFLAALAVYGLFSWFTMVWTACLLTETLVLFFTAATLAFCAEALERGRALCWAGAGAACGLAALTRPDSVLLLGAVLVLLAWRVLRGGARRAAGGALALFCLAFALTLAPWTVRNYLALDSFQPLASEYGCARDCYFPEGYLRWVSTWIEDESHFDYAFAPAWSPGKVTLDPALLPRAAYDSEAERLRVAGLVERYNRAGLVAPEADEEFRALARERVARAPFRFFVTLPLYRLASMWLTGFSTSRPTPYLMLIRVCTVVPIHLGALLCFALWCRGRPLAWLLLLVALVRSAFFAFHYAPETRYIVEAYPAVIAAGGVTAAAAWAYLNDWLRVRKGGSIQ